jgi:pimeloyl-ACP methyl ester carboxylesterase
MIDDDLWRLAAKGLPPLPEADSQGFVPIKGAKIWFAAYASGPAVILLHGGMGQSGQWAYLVPELIGAGFRVVLLDSRGQGRSSWGGEPFSYRQMAQDTLAVMDRLGVEEAAIVGWSDGADTALAMAELVPERVRRIYFFACNVDGSGTKPFVFTQVIGRFLEQQKRDYRALSPTPDDFDRVFEAVGLMQRTQPDYSAEDLRQFDVPVHVVLGEGDEFITEAHLRFLAETLPRAQFELLPGVSHFAPVQRPKVFNASVLRFLRTVFVGEE